MAQTSSSMSTIRPSRGEIFYVVPVGNEVIERQFVGGRPAIIVSNDMNNEFNGVVEVIYLTRQTHCKTDLPTNVLIRSTGLASIALCNQIYTVAKKRIGKFVGQCTADEMSHIETAMGISLCVEDIFSSKKLIEAIALWKENILAGKDTEEISLLDEPVPAVSKEQVVKPVVDSKPIVNLAEQDISTHPMYIKMCAEKDRISAERDLLKSMYEGQIERMIKERNDSCVKKEA